MNDKYVKESEDESYCKTGNWVLVPEELPTPAVDILAYFDMSRVGNGPEEAASECWARLLSEVAHQPKILEFQNPVFNSGWNTTVRRGRKWSKEQWARVKIGECFVVVELHSLTYRFNQLTDHTLRNEHDPSCVTVEGLLKEMCRVYPGFSKNEEVTVVNFYLPIISKGE